MILGSFNLNFFLNLGRIIYNHNIIFTNYYFIIEEKPFEPKNELKKDEKFCTSTLEETLQLFEYQNRVV